MYLCFRFFKKRTHFGLGGGVMRSLEYRKTQVLRSGIIYFRSKVLCIQKPCNENQGFVIQVPNLKNKMQLYLVVLIAFNTYLVLISQWFRHSVFSVSFCWCRNAHSHGNQYSTIMQQPSLLTNHVTLATAQPLNVGVAHVVRQPQSSSLPSKKNKQSAPVSSK